MFGRSYRSIGLLVCFFWLLVIAPAWSMEKPKESKAPKIEPQAMQVLKQMTDYLQGLQQFSLQAEITGFCRKVAFSSIWESASH
jgi:hypothetical protein